MNSVGATVNDVSSWRLIASICSSSASSIRATGIACWPTRTTHCTAASSDGNVHCAAAVASGIGCRRSVASQMSASVPSEPMISRVRS